MFFFFKQKTAYEMRISDWSSDVCSSDLEPLLRLACGGPADRDPRSGGAAYPGAARSRLEQPRWRGHQEAQGRERRTAGRHCLPPVLHRERRSEEHTSELQSLMRISYAVFCLKKKTYELQLQI